MTFFHGLGMFLILLATVIVFFIVNHLEKRDDEME